MHCFVIMPFGDPDSAPELHRRSEHIYSQWIKPAVESVVVGSHDSGQDAIIRCLRADKVARSGEVIMHVLEHLTSADIVIADLTGRNANVFYELGVRHATADNTILIAQDIDDVPFDLRTMRVIEYSYDLEGMVALRDSLRLAVREIVDGPQRIDNPVRRHLRSAHTAERDGDQTQQLLADVESLRQDLAAQSREMRRLVELVTSKTTSSTAATLDLGEYGGCWTSVEHGGLYCVGRKRDGTWAVPYCYSEDDHLTAHMFDLAVVEDTVFGKFQWLGETGRQAGIKMVGRVHGFVMLRAATPTALSMGWWYAEDVPPELQRDLTSLNEGVGAMNQINLVRIVRTTFPAWAEAYFARPS